MWVQFWKATRKMQYTSWCVQVIIFRYLQLPIFAIKHCITNRVFNVTALTVITDKDYR